MLIETPHPRAAPTRRSLAIVAIAGGAILGIFVARLALSSGPETGVTFLLAIPVAVVAHELGRLPGLAAAAAAIGLVAMWARISNVDIEALGYASRAVIFAGAALLADLAARRAPEPDSPPGVAPAQPQRPSPLSPREREVLGLLAAGHTNREIADRLVISVRTVETHRARIQTKLGCSGRAALFHHALELGLLEPQPATPV